MRLLITTDTVGGVWTFSQELTSGLLEVGHAVVLVSFGRMPSSAQKHAIEEAYERYGASFRYVASDVPLEWMESNEFAYRDGAGILRREAALFGVDLIHTNQFCYGAIDIPLPRIVTAHSDVLSWAKACRSEPLPDSPWLRNYINLVQSGLSKADAVVAPTAWMLEALRQSFRIPLQAVVISNGRSVTPSRKLQRGLQAVTAGRFWDEAKDVTLIGQVECAFPIILAGETRPKDPVRIGSAKMIGALAERELIDLFAASSIYLCLSRYEPFGLAPLEAAMCGCAVLARNIPSLREVWEDSALYFDTPGGLSAILQELAADAAMLQSARHRAHMRAKMFTREAMIGGYLDCYRAVLAQTPRQRYVA